VWKRGSLLSQEGRLRDVLPAQPGWFLRIHVQFRPRNHPGCAFQMMLRDILLMPQPPLLT